MKPIMPYIIGNFSSGTSLETIKIVSFLSICKVPFYKDKIKKINYSEDAFVNQSCSFYTVIVAISIVSDISCFNSRNDILLVYGGRQVSK